MSAISERFSKIMATKGLKNVDISKKYSISRQLVNNFFTKQKTITENFAMVCEGEDINIYWLFTGQGLPTRSKPAQKVINSGKMGNSSIVGNNISLSNVNITNGSQHPKEVTNLEDDMLECYRALEIDMQEYYYHKIKADSLAQKMKNKA